MCLFVFGSMAVIKIICSESLFIYYVLSTLPSCSVLTFDNNIARGYEVIKLILCGTGCFLDLAD